MKKSKVTDLVQVGNAVLNHEAQKYLEGLQEDGNYGVNIIREDLADAVCFIGRSMSNLDENWQEEANKIIAALSMIRENINDLKKP